MATTPIADHLRLRLDPSTGQLEAMRCEVVVVAGPSKSSTATPIHGLLTVGSAAEARLQVADETVSRVHLQLAIVERGVHFKDLGSTNGTVLAGARVDEGVLTETATLTLGQSAIKVYLTRFEVELESPPSRLGDAVGVSRSMRTAFAALSRIAAGGSTVLIAGENGTGKELLARGTHAASRRSGGPFHVVDCAAISAELVESELFGHVKGAFSGAVRDQPGAFVAASGGTLFLDHLGELPLPLQPKLLRALEAREVRPVGGDRYRSVDVRVIASAQRDLERDVAEGRFRADLYYRVAVVLVSVPPLRERPEDVPVLVEHFLTQLGKPGLTLPAELMQKLEAHNWPGNARELRNVLESGLSLGEFEVKAEAAARPAALPFHEAKNQLVEAFEREYLAGLLKQTGGNISEVARLSGISRVSVHRLVKRHKLRAADARGDDEG